MNVNCNSKNNNNNNVYVLLQHIHLTKEHHNNSKISPSMKKPSIANKMYPPFRKTFRDTYDLGSVVRG